MYVRSLQKQDEQLFLQLNEKFYSSGATLRGFDRDLTLKTFEQVTSKHENLWGYFIVDKDTEKEVGYALVTSYWCNEDGGNIIILDELFIDTVNRHKGYAKQFMDWVEQEFAGKAVSITLEVVTTNIIAKELYTKAGYAEDGFEVMTKRLPNKF